MPAGVSPEILISPAALLGLVFVLVMFGALVPGRTHGSIVRALKEENQFLRARNTEQSEQIKILATNSETALHIGDELRRVAGATPRPLSTIREEEPT
jgi:hypothetical protein